MKKLSALTDKEYLYTSGDGGYLSTTQALCNTRKYHGLLAVSVSELEYERYLLLSSLDERVTVNGKVYELATHQYPGVVHPQGYGYITETGFYPSVTYSVGGVTIRKELVLVQGKQQLLIRYSVSGATGPVRIDLMPLLAYRRIHALSHANDEANAETLPVPGGVKARVYEWLPEIYMQMNREAAFVKDIQWYYNFLYEVEHERGYDYAEDLITPGYFTLTLNNKDTFVFSCSTQEETPGSFAAAFRKETKRNDPDPDFAAKLKRAASQFVIRQGKDTKIIAGYPWFGAWGRDTFISLPGLTLSLGDAKTCEAVVDTQLKSIRNGLFVNMGHAYNSVDAPLWFFYALQKLEEQAGTEKIRKKYYKTMKAILEAFRDGVNPGIAMHPNGLVWASLPGHALTWMDAVVDGEGVTPRNGYQVEINALWYNAVCYTLQMAEAAGDKKFIREWLEIPGKTKEAFRKFFVREENGYLADYAGPDGVNCDLRPNQLIACSVPYTMLEEAEMEGVLKSVKRSLLTPKGLRTLSPESPDYCGVYGGSQPQRDRQYHNGTVWPWLLEHYVLTGFRLYGKKFRKEAETILNNFIPDMESYGIGSVAEVYNGNAPYAPNGSIAQAWSVGALLSIAREMKKYGKEE